MQASKTVSTKVRLPMRLVVGILVSINQYAITLLLNFTLQYPVDWTVKYKQPVTKFDKPTAIFTTNHPVSVVTISVKPSTDNTPEEFRYSMSSQPER
jgi:hypothetical protein